MRTIFYGGQVYTGDLPLVSAFAVEDGRVVLRTNHCGGILGGVSVGAPIVVRVAFKPTPSISLEQDSVDLATMTPVKLTVKGRHDRCVAYRGAVAAEAATAIVLDDMLQEAGL